MSDLRSLPERMQARITVSEGGCWNWAGIDSSRGYGVTSVGGQRWLMHRFTYTALVGEIPAGLQIDHLCRNRACCNPEHLEPVTSRENTARGTNKAATNIRTGKCHRGHLSPGRSCPACDRLKVRKYHDRKRDEARSARAAAAARGEVYIAPIDNHGVTGYRLHSCRCETCRAAHSASLKRHRARKGEES